MVVVSLCGEFMANLWRVEKEASGLWLIDHELHALHALHALHESSTTKTLMKLCTLFDLFKPQGLKKSIELDAFET
jgi:hypothetical protein